MTNIQLNRTQVPLSVQDLLCSTFNFRFVSLILARFAAVQINYFAKQEPVVQTCKFQAFLAPCFAVSHLLF